MFFIASKVLAFLLQPLTWVVTLLLLSLLFHKKSWGRTCLYWGFGLLLFFSNHFIANWAFRAWELPPIEIKDLESYEVGIVLTGITDLHRKPNDRVHFNKGADRIIHAIDLYKKGKIKTILITGGTGSLLDEGIPEALQLAKVCEMAGIPPEHIWVEDQARNTRENALFSQEMLGKKGLSADQCLIITSAFHMRRSLACFKKIKFEAHYFPTDYYSIPPRYTPEELLFPSIEALQKWTKLFKEWFGYLAYRLAGYA